jgi:hypothetical protein
LTNLQAVRRGKRIKKPSPAVSNEYVDPQDFLGTGEDEDEFENSSASYSIASTQY